MTFYILLATVLFFGVVTVFILIGMGEPERRRKLEEQEKLVRELFGIDMRTAALEVQVQALREQMQYLFASVSRPEGG